VRLVVSIVRAREAVRRRWLLPGLTALVAAGFLIPHSVAADSRGAQTPGDEDTAELVNTLLAGLLGFGEVSESELSAEVAEAGGVPFKTPVRLEYMDKAELKAYLTELFEEDYPVSEGEADRRTLTAFDLLTPGTDLRALRARVLEENVVGFYDERPDRRKLYVVSGDRRLTPMNQLVLSHELRHALQDQYMAIHDLLGEGVSDYDDRRMALLSLLEGDATFVMEKFLMKRLPGGGLSGLGDGGSFFGLGAMASAAVPDAPPVVRDQLVLPYFAGRDFVDAVFKRGGWDGVRAAWARPPGSTEQILHPEKYASGEAPRRVLAPSAGAGRVVREGVLGEALVRTWLGEGSDRAAAGWGGDAFRCLDVGGRTLLVWRSEWDSPAEASEFLAAARHRMSSLGTPVAREGWDVVARGDSRFALGFRNGGVELVSADAPGTFDRALRTLGRADKAVRGVSGLTPVAPAP
jgi:hypothetical protein